MTTPGSRLLGDLPDPKRARDENLEFAVVRRIFQRAGEAGLNKYNELQILNYQETGERGTPFSLFFREYPLFPVQFAFSWISEIHKITLFDALAKGSVFSSKLYRTYCDAVTSAGVDLKTTYFGLVFPIAYQTKFVFHNKPRDEETWDRVKAWPRLVLPLSKVQPPLIFSVEPLDGLLDDIGDAWLS